MKIKNSEIDDFGVLNLLLNYGGSVESVGPFAE